MILRLTRKLSLSDGIFSDLSMDDGKIIAVTLEHSYPFEEYYRPKIPNGTFNCIRGTHQLFGHSEQFETFEITGVMGHSGLLFHCGNFNQDSEGCILIGEKIAQTGSEDLITNSRATFAALMQRLAGIDEFQLVVVG